MLRKINFLFFCVGLCGSLPTIPVAHAATTTKKICISRAGALVLRTKCGRSEKIYSPVTFPQSIAASEDAIGPQGAQGPVGPQGPQGAQGPQGHQGIAGSIKGPKGKIDFSACRLSSEGYGTNFSNPSNPVVYAEAFCNPNTEFILEDEYKVRMLPGSEGTDVAIQARLPYTQNIAGDVKEYGVGVYANRINVAGSGIFELLVRAYCCPR